MKKPDKNPCKNHPSFPLGTMGCGCLVAEAFDLGLEKHEFGDRNKPAVRAMVNASVLIAAPELSRPGYLGFTWVFLWKIDKKRNAFVVISEEADSIVVVYGDQLLLFRNSNVAIVLAKSRGAIDAPPDEVTLSQITPVGAVEHKPAGLTENQRLLARTAGEIAKDDPAMAKWLTGQFQKLLDEFELALKTKEEAKSC